LLAFPIERQYKEVREVSVASGNQQKTVSKRLAWKLSMRLAGTKLRLGRSQNVYLSQENKKDHEIDLTVSDPLAENHFIRIEVMCRSGKR
jgi:hypothetical protein